MKFALWLGLLTGAVFGFLESLLCYGTGTIFRGDVLFVFPLGLLVWGLAGAALSLGGLVIPPRVLKSLAAFALLSMPIATFALRGAFAAATLGQRSWAVWLRWGGSAALVALVAFFVWPRARGLGLDLVRLTWLSATVQGLAGFALLLRTLGPRTSGALPLPALAGAFLAYVLLLALMGRALQAREGAWTAATVGLSAALAGIVALTLGGSGVAPASRDGGSRSAASGSASPAGPNVLLVTLDTVRRDHLSCYGYARRTTPRLDAFAARATLFEDAYASSPYTLSSHASLFTGLLPSAHGAHPIPFDATEKDAVLSVWDYPLPRGATTIAEQLRARGYVTAGIAANAAYLAPWTGLNQGFDHYDCQPGRRYRYVPLVLPFSRHFMPPLYDHMFEGQQRPANEITDAAIAWLGTPKRPFFLFLNYLDAHSPYAPPSPYDRAFAPPPGAKHVSRADERATVLGQRAWRPGEADYLITQYDGELAFLDAEVGRLLDWLDKQGLLEQTLVIVTSDHGEFFGEHGFAGHQKALYEAVLRIPLLVKLPGQTQARRVPGRTGLHHVPALIEAVLDGGEDTSSIAASSSEPTILAEYWTPPTLHRLDPKRYASPLLRAAYYGDWKLIDSSLGRQELYDLKLDPGEGSNRAAELPDALRALAPLTASAPPRPESLDPEAVERLRSLGYAQ